MWHTLQDAIELTGRSRRSLYRDMDAGRVSYRVRADGRRELETSELMRAYGALLPVAQADTAAVAQADTPHGTPAAGSSEQMGALLEELRLLREEVASLRAAMLRLEYKPEHPPAAVPAPQAAPVPAAEPAAQERRPAKSFADLLAEL